MTVSLDSLDLDEETRAMCRQVIRKMAYSKWVDAGSPESDGLAFWIQAEREWIERHYVPSRLPAAVGQEPTPDRATPTRIKSPASNASVAAMPV